MKIEVPNLIGKEIIGRTDPVAKRGNAPPDPIDETCGLIGNVGKTGGTIPPGAAVKVGNGCVAIGNWGPIPTKPEFSRGRRMRRRPAPTGWLCLDQERPG